MNTLYAITLFPIELLYQAIYLSLYHVTSSLGLSLILLSCVSFLLMMPLEKCIRRFQTYETDLQSVLTPQLNKIKAESTGAERQRRINGLYKRYSYHPIFAIRGSMGLLVQVPFLMAAYYMLSSLPVLQGQSFLFIKDLAKPDGLLAGFNLLPFVMTFVNLLAVYIYPSPNGQKGKIQLYAMALFFLVLLYAAPSALVFYWTVNNVLSLLKSLYQKKSKRLCTQNIVFHSVLLQKIKFSLAYAFVPVFCVMYFIFINFYSINYLDIGIPARLYFEYTILVAGCAYFVTTLIIFFIPQNIKFFQSAIAFIFSIALCILVQYFSLNIGYDLLDGGSKLEVFKPIGILSAVIWLSIIVLFQIKRHKISPLLHVCMLSLCLVITAFNLSKENSIDYASTSREYKIVSNANFFSFSKEKNIVVFVLDTFGYRGLDEVLDDERGEYFKDFYSLNNLSHVFPTTYASINAILTGKAYDNSQPFTEFVQSVKDDSITIPLSRAGYSSNIKSETQYPAINVAKAITEKKSYFTKYIPVFSAVIYSIFPHHIKKYANDNASILLSKCFAKNDTTNNYYVQAGKDAGVMWDFNFLQDMLNAEFTANKNSNVFHFIHLIGAHPPFRVNKNFSILKNTSFEEQKRASLELVNIYIEKMKEIGVYDNTMIVVTADHTLPSQTHYMQDTVLGLIKPFNRTASNIETISAPYSLVDLKQIITDSAVKNIVIDQQYFTKNQNTNRFYRHYVWDDVWNKKYLPTMTEYIIKGDPSKKENYEKKRVLRENTYTFSSEEIYHFPENFSKLHVIFETWSKSETGIVSGAVGPGKHNRVTINFNPAKQKRYVSFVLEDSYNQSAFLHADSLCRQDEKQIDCVENENNSVTIYFKENVILNKLYTSTKVPESLILKTVPLDSKVTVGKLLSIFLDSSTGFSSPESWGTWTDGDKASISFKLAPESKAISLDVMPFGEQNVTIKANDTLVFEGKITAPAEGIHFDLPEAVRHDIAEDKIISLDFDLPDAKSPKELGQSEDRRVLALGFKSITIHSKKLKDAQ